MSRPHDRDGDPQPLGAVRLFARMFGKLAGCILEGRVPPTEMALLFDPPRAASWRRALSPAYKADRPEHPADLVRQAALIQTLVRASGAAAATADAFEADDLIAAHAGDAAARGDRATIVSSDKDLMQLVRPGVLQFDPARDRWFDSARVVAKTGLEPVRIRDWLALAGDSSDSIPGVPGIGTKRATDLLARYGDIDALLEAGEAIQPAVCRSALLANREALTLSRQLAMLDAAAPRLLDRGTMRAPDRERMREAIGTWLAANAI